MAEQLQISLGTWKETLEKELTELIEKETDIRTAIADKRQKIDAIAKLLGQTGSARDETRSTEREPSLDATQPTDHRDRKFTPVNAYWRPILEVIVEAGGRKKRLQVVDAVGIKMKDILRPADYEELPNTFEVRWRNRVIWQASNMRQRGFISKAERGVWEITPAGRRWLDDNP